MGKGVISQVTGWEKEVQLRLPVRLGDWWWERHSFLMHEINPNDSCLTGLYVSVSGANLETQEM